MKVIITTVGTSLFENYSQNKEKIHRTEKFKYSIKEKGLSDYDDFKKNIQEDGLLKKLKEYIKHNFPQASAELTSLQKLKEKSPNEDFIIYLLISDTFEGYFIGEILKETLKSKILKERLNINTVEVKHIENLRIDKRATFEKGIDNLINEIHKIIKNYKENIIFNITGGFKGIIPFISLIAQIFRYKIIYTFEDIEIENELIEIKPLPLGFDDKYLESIFWELYLLDKGEEIHNIELLENYGLIKKNKLTQIGKIFLNELEKTELSIEKIFAKLVEYKITEIFNKNERNVKHSIKDENIEIDILDEDKKIAYEIKALKTFKRLSLQTEKRRIEHLQNEYKIKTYSYIIYTLYKDYRKIINKKRNFLKNLVNEIKNIDFNLYLLDLSNLTTSQNPYQSFIDKENLKVKTLSINHIIDKLFKINEKEEDIIHV